jgi:hypothetical protein
VAALVSTFVWPVESSSGFDTVVAGLLVVMFSVVALWVPQSRFGNLAVAVWVVFDALFFRHRSVARTLGNLIVGFAIAALSLRDTPARFVDPRRRA